MPKRESRSRTDLEAIIMAKEMPYFKFVRRGGTEYFIGEHTTSDGRFYRLVLFLDPPYPEKIPNLYVIYPSVLPKYGQGSINELGNSHAFHTNSNGPDGVVAICHYSSSEWDTSCTAYGVIIRGLIWLEAYAIHLKTGETIVGIIDKLLKNAVQH
ncbi:MAG: hypothetical protein C4582_05665 [Desulfobacteraceae bacterium]|jgi:hypothetical protein|nr:MAG: hypothetical protein C4582_05665 [Desulfobacteraceae bacterium]